MRSAWPGTSERDRIGKVGFPLHCNCSDWMKGESAPVWLANEGSGIEMGQLADAVRRRWPAIETPWIEALAVLDENATQSSEGSASFRSNCVGEQRLSTGCPLTSVRRSPK